MTQNLFPEFNDNFYSLFRHANGEELQLYYNYRRPNATHYKLIECNNKILIMILIFILMMILMILVIN